ncbi:AMIN-like domain-containing (lipo)protein [Corynebacterium alimapuense]|uniref:AMIN-like domain-containing protein n=1 Tax=Corynebacterium alimapuense TaxID=1576874 RepID=A0A3M8K7U4_9CORY|nr:hypothetical protein [Corynebacterium alimapuense]RNE48825.1 hypothetical protein C5L39_05855 [Corynebacterium alimapuense]
MIEPLRTSSQRRTTLAAIVAAGALGLASCGAGTSTDTDATSNAVDESTDASMMSMDSSASASSTDAGVTPLGTADIAQKTLRPEASSQLMVSNVRVGSHEGVDRVVFDLVGEGEPGWFIDYTDSPAQQGSGTAIEFEGDTALNVNIDGTAYPFELGKEDPDIGTVDGAGSITQIVSAGTFEGRSQFVIGLNEQQPYSVQVLQDPHRLVIDFPQG